MRNDKTQFMSWLRCAAVATLLSGLTAPAFAQKAFESPEAAAAAFQAAVAANDQAAMRTVLGNNWRTFIPARTVDKADIDAFLADWAKSHRIVAQTPEKSMLEVGDQGWTLPIPIVKRKAGWKFDRWLDLVFLQRMLQA